MVLARELLKGGEEGPVSQSSETSVGTTLGSRGSGSLEGNKSMAGPASSSALPSALSPSSTPKTSGGGLATGLEEKRVKNSRIKEALGVRLSFPSYREGLLSIHQGDLRPFHDHQDLAMLKGDGGSKQSEA